MVSFLACIGTMMATATDLPVVSTEGNITWYTIKNVRGNVYAAFTGSGAQMKLNSTIEDESYLFYFTAGENGGYKIHNAATSNLCAGHSSWTAAGTEWYLRANSNANYPGISISNTSTYEGNSCWNDAGNSHTLVAYWTANDDGSAWVIENYTGDVAALKASKLQMSTNEDKHFYYIKNRRRNGKFANFVGQGTRFTQISEATAGSYWYFVDATNELPAGTQIPEGCAVCRIYNAGSALGVENTNGNMVAANAGAKIYFIRKHDSTYWGDVIYPYNEAGAGWNDLDGTEVTNYNYNDAGSIWSIVAAGKTEDDLKNEAAAAKTSAMTLITTAEGAAEASYYNFPDDAIATAKAAVKDLDVTTDLVSAVSSHIAINAAVSTLKATKTAGPAVGDYIRFKNRAKGVYMAATVDDNDMIRKSNDKTDLNTLWLVEAGDNGSVKLKNVATQKYIGAISESADVKQKESAEASQFTFVNVADVYGTFQTTGGGDYAYANLNEWGGVYKVVGWEKNDQASQWLICEAYPLTIIYQFEDAEVEELRIETYVDAGAVYTIQNRAEHDGKFIVSCKIGENSVEKVDGTWPVSVNAATTVTVTLKDPTLTGNGSMGVVDVANYHQEGLAEIPAGTGWTISLDVENPNGASFNQYGTSIFAIGTDAFPEKNGYKGLQFYLQSAANGGKLDAVFDGGDHLINNVTYTGNFSASISYNGGKQLQIKTTNASGTVAVNDYTLNNALGAFSQMAYGLPTGINVKNLQIAPLSNTVDYPTAGTVTNSKYTFTSNNILYAGTCNKIRFTLTESGAFYKDGAKRLSFDSFTLYDANGNEVELKESYFSGNNNKSYAGLLDGINAGTDGAGCCCGTWASGTEDDYFEILLPASIDLGGAFSFSFVTENTTMNAKAFRIETSYEKAADYTFSITGNGENEVTVTHKGEALTDGSTIAVAEFDADLVSATEIPGYTWSIVVNDEDATITLVYTEAPITEEPASVVALVNRIGGAGTDAKFKFVLDPSINSKQEVFVIGSEDNKILIKGTTISAITTGLGWYLNHIAKINIAWNSLNEKTVSGAAYADLSNIPVPTAEETHTSDAKYRYYLNTCTFGYSMTSWTWKRWQQEIDWMALHGVNMPLQLVGLEEVWRSFLIKCGYTETDAKAFVAGPAFIPWWAMNNLEGWGGTAEGTKSGGTWAGAGGVQDDAWYARQKNLANQIVTRQRELGMQPVLPGWSGMVPTNFNAKTGYVTRGNGGNWAGDFVRPLLLSISNANYAEIAADYYACLKEVMGESQYYSMDPFHEGGGTAYDGDYTALYNAMETANPGSQWVIQQWQWNGGAQTKSLTEVPEGKLIVLDLFSDGLPEFDSWGYNGYAPHDAVFCAIPNFGGRSGLMGRLNNLTDNYFKFKGKYASIKGIGAAPEAIEQTPVTYDLIFQLPWMNGEKPDVAEWVKNYATARYGVNNAVTQEAWDLLRQGPLNYGADNIQGPVEDVWAARPNLEAYKVSAWGKTLNDAIGTYTKARQQMLIDAVYKLLSQEDAIGASDIFQSNYNYDLVEFGGGVMADYAYYLLKGIKSAKTAAGTNFATDATYIARRDAFLALIADVDAFKGTNLNFRLGKWTQEARDAASEVVNPTSATADWYEYNNARTIISTWSHPSTNLTDYSYRSWQGLMKDLYLPRWEYFFKNKCTPERDPAQFPNTPYGYFEWNWAHGKEHYVGQTAVSNVALSEGQAGHTSSYTREPEGNTVESATALLSKYIIPVTVNSSTYYAYRYLDNDVSSMATIPASAGAIIDLTPYFGKLTDISSFTSDAVSGTVTDLSEVTIKAGATDGAHSATITLNDGTTLTFYFSINPKYNGVYQLKYNDTPTYIQYHEGGDNHTSKGYKWLGSGGTGTVGGADTYFTITPSGAGYALSAQGKYLKPIHTTNWQHLMFSDNKADAGAYLINDVNTENATVKFQSTLSHSQSCNYIGNYNSEKNGTVFANESQANANTFTIVSATSYPFNVSAAEMATLCLPFNVVMAENMYAYDFTVSNIKDGDEAGEYVCTMKVIANPGETLKAGTPVIISAPQGNYDLAINFGAQDVKTSLNGSVLRGNFVKQTLVQEDDAAKFIFAKGLSGVGFYRMQEEGGSINANKCWMEWNVTNMPSDAQALTIRFENPTAVTTIIETQKPESIYDITGRKLSKPQHGINIINGKKVIL